MWSVRTIANHGVAAIAEDANNAVLESALPGLPGIQTVETGGGGPIPPGATRTYMVQTRGNFDRLTVLTMLVNTNDGFTGLDSVKVRQLHAVDHGLRRRERAQQRAGRLHPGPVLQQPLRARSRGRA